MSVATKINPDYKGHYEALTPRGKTACFLHLDALIDCLRDEFRVGPEHVLVRRVFFDGTGREGTDDAATATVKERLSR